MYWTVIPPIRSSILLWHRRHCRCGLLKVPYVMLYTWGLTYFLFLCVCVCYLLFQDKSWGRKVSKVRRNSVKAYSTTNQLLASSGLNDESIINAVMFPSDVMVFFLVISGNRDWHRASSLGIDKRGWSRKSSDAQGSAVCLITFLYSCRCIQGQRAGSAAFCFGEVLWCCQTSRTIN